MNESKTKIRLLVPIKGVAHGETIQDILFANKDQQFEAIYFLHVVENDLIGNPAYTSMEAIGRLKKQDRVSNDARAFLDELASRVASFIEAEMVSEAVIADNIANYIVDYAENNRCNQVIMLADTSSFSDSWFNTSVLKTVLKKAPLDLRVHVIRPAESEGLSFGLKLK